MTNQQLPTPIVLVVEDEDLLRCIAVDLVKDAGFDALQAANRIKRLLSLRSEPTSR
jgi:DNA-binding response OmpR family regulator